MTPSDLYTYIFLKTKGTTDEISSEEMRLLTNIRIKDIAGKIAFENKGYYGVAVQYDLSEDQREYVLSNVMLNSLKMIEVQMDGTNWKKVKLYDFDEVNELTKSDFVWQESWITGHYDNTEPYGFIFGNRFWLLSGSVSDVKKGLRIWFNLLPPDIESMADTYDLSIRIGSFYLSNDFWPEQRGTIMFRDTFRLGIPPQFHELLGRSVIVDYKEIYDMPLKGRELTFNVDLVDKLKEFKIIRQTAKAGIPHDTGEDY
jgi:hypothetical protein